MVIGRSEPILRRIKDLSGAEWRRKAGEFGGPEGHKDALAKADLFGKSQFAMIHRSE